MLLASALPSWQLQMGHYLDDFISVLPAHTDPLPPIRQYEDLCWFLGLQDNLKKAAHGTHIECLGIEIDTTKMTACLPSSKIEKGLQIVIGALKTGHLTLHMTEKLTGFLSFCTTVIPLGRTFLARLWQFHRTFRDPNAHRPLTANAIKDLNWWRDMLPSSSGLHLLDDMARLTFHLWMDASKHVLGGFFYESTPAKSIG